MKKFAIKGLLAVFGIMALFTMISRIASSLTVAKVTTEAPSSKKIEHIVQAEGTVEKNREIAILTQPDILVKTVTVNEGEKIEQGQVLAELDLEHLQECILKVENEIKELKLQNEASQGSTQTAKESKERDISRSKEDYTRTLQEQTTAYQQALANLKQAKQNLEEYETKQANKKQQGSEESQDSTEESQKETLEAAVSNAQQSYDQAVTSYQQAMLEAERKVEDAENTEISNDASVEINNIVIEEKQKQLKKLQQLKEEEGKILAPSEGVITKNYLMAGQKTTDTAAFTVADLSSGMRYVAEIKKEDKKYVQVGDKVTLELTGSNIEDLSIQSIEEKEDSNGYQVTVMLPKDALSIGDSATLKVVKQSETYSTTVPLSAIHREDSKDYVYVAEEMNTVLGAELVVRAIEVTILEKNNQYAALMDGNLTTKMQIITDSDRYIEAGKRVRLQDS